MNDIDLCIEVVKVMSTIALGNQMVT